MQKVFLTILLVVFSLNLFSQENIFEIMYREDLTINQIESLAKKYFEKAGTGRGSGYKQYQRWLYERKFHLDQQGYFIQPQVEHTEFNNSVKANKKLNHTNAGLTGASGIWTEKGPFNWNLTSSWNPGTGRLSAVAIHPLNENIIYVGSPGGGLWKTIDGGVSWQPLTDYNYTWMSIYSLAIDPLNQNIIYAGTGNSANQVIKSTDAGATWAPTGSGPTGTIKKILIHPTSTNIIFACASNGIFRSVNSGLIWTRVHIASKEDIEFKPNDPNIMYATGNEVVRSVNNGVTWTVLGSVEGITNTGRTLVAVTPANPDYVYVAQASGSLFGRMYKSTDAGVSFITTVIGDPADSTNYFGYSTGGTGTTGQATYDMAMCVSPVNAEEIHIAGIICWKSIDGGFSFTATTGWNLPNNFGYNHADVHGLHFVNNNIYSISDGGIYFSYDFGDHWIDLSPGLGIRQFYRIASSPTNATVVTGGAQDNGSVTMQSTGTWVDWLGADGMEGLVSPTNHLNIWGTSQEGGFYKSTDGGTTKVNIADIPNGAWVTPIAIHPTDESILYGGGDGVYQSTDSGASWTLISGTTIVNSLSDLAVAPSNANYIYASYSSTLYATTDGGANWAVYFTPGSITDICVSPSDPAKIWITTSNGIGKVYKSLNSGQTFANITGTLPNIAARTIVVDNTADERLFVGMNIGVYTLSNSNPAWASMTDNLPLVAINELDIQHSASILRVATYGRGVWETSSAISSSCNAPSSLTATGITMADATINWDTINGALSYTLEYKLNSDTAWTLASASISATSYSLTGLADSSLYDYRIKSNCIGTTSAFSQSSFITLDGHVSVDEIQSDTQHVFVFPNPVANILNIEFAGLGKIEEVDVLDVLGVRKLKSENITQAILKLNVAVLSPGIYLIRILDDNRQMHFATFIKE